jgi:hypothetical protein
MSGTTMMVGFEYQEAYPSDNSDLNFPEQDNRDLVNQIIIDN